MSWLNAEAARLLALKTFNPPHTHTLTHRLAHTANYPGTYTNRPKTAWAWQKKGKNGVEHATLIFIDFILTPKRQTHQGWNPSSHRPTFRPPIRCHAPAPPRCAGNVSLASALLACLHQIGKASSQPAKKRVHYGNLLKLVCLPMIGRGVERGKKRETAGRGLRQFQVCVFFFGISQPLKSTQWKTRHNLADFFWFLLVLFSFLWGFYFAAPSWSFRTRCAEKVHKI